MSESWDTVEMIFLTLPHCPHCGELDPVIVRTQPRETDGSFTRRCVCRSCSRRFLIVFEPPANHWQNTPTERVDCRNEQKTLCRAR